MADKQAYGFDKNGMKRAINVIRKVEGTPNGNTPGPRPMGNSSPGFWAKITGKKADSYKYSWKQLMWNDIDASVDASSLIVDPEDELEFVAWDDGSERYAVESLNRSSYVPIGSYVWLMPAIDQPYYWFDFEGRSRFAKVGSTAIPALDDTTMGNGSVYLYKSAGGNFVVDTDNPTTMKAYNWVPDTIAANSFVSMTHIEGSWKITGAPC